MKAFPTFCVALVSSTLLVACGGGGDSSQPSVVADSSETSAASQNPDGSTLVISGCEVEQYQADMLESVNAARATARSCGSEHFAAAAPLAYSCQIEGAASKHSNDMASNNFFSHTGSDGLRVSHRVTETGYDWSIVGENIAAGYSSVNSVMQGWLDSPGHCRNIMDPRFTEFAVDRVNTDSADYDNYWTQVFADAR